MAVKDFFDNLNGGARWDVGVSINRSNSLPLDANSVFDSLEAAQNYAKGTPAEGTLANAYPGQVLAVVTDAETIIYYIDANMALQPVGNTKEVMAYIGDIPETSDAKTIVEYINSKTEGIATKDSLAQLQKDVQALAATVNGKDAVGEEGAEDYVPAVIGLVDEVADIKATIGVEASEGVEATGLEKKIADEIAARQAGDKTNADNIAALDLVVNGREASDGVEAVTGLTTLVSNKADKATTLEGYGITDAGVTITEDTSDSTIAKKYIFKQGEKEIGSIDLAKELVVTSGSVKEVTEEGKPYPKAEVGDKYIELVIANQENPIYVPAKDLVDTYTAKADATDVQVAISNTNEISATLTDAVKEKLNKAHEHGNKALLDSYDQTNENIKDAVNKRHDHSNATVIDAITAEKVAAWDIAEKNVIASVDEAQFNIDADRKLTLLDIAQDKISGLTNSAGNEVTLAELLASKVDKVEGSRLINEDEIKKLEGLVVDPDTGETSLPISGQIAMSQVDGLSGALDGKVDKVEGMGLSANNFTDTLLEKLNGIQAGAQVNVIEGIKFNGATVTVGEDKIADITYALPIADADTLGGVKSIEAILGDDGKITNAVAIENKIKIYEDGTMEVNSLNVNKLVQTDGEYLVLNGGSAIV